MSLHYAKQSCPLVVTFGTKKKTIIPLVESMTTKVDKMLTIVYDDDDSADDMYIAIG